MNCPRCNGPLIGRSLWCKRDGDLDDFYVAKVPEDVRTWDRSHHPRGAPHRQYERELPLPGFES